MRAEAEAACHGGRTGDVCRHFPALSLIIGLLAMSLLLEAGYTTWAVRHDQQQTCTLLRAQERSTFYPESLRHDFRMLAAQRGC